MNFDLALILTLLTLFTGIVVAIDRFWLRKQRAEGEGHPNRGMHLLIDYSRSFFPVLLFVLVIRSFIFEPFRIPSGSMRPTLLEGDYIFVTKFAYGLRLPVTHTEIIETGRPERGDVVVFRKPQEPSINYIKRVVGLPGDTIEYRNHQLIVNGEPVPKHQVPDEGIAASLDKYVEVLDGQEHGILISEHGPARGEGVYRVPEGQYFMFGDNRDNSEDSRFIGPVPEKYLVGHAVRIWMHMDGLEWPDWGRIGNKIE